MTYEYEIVAMTSIVGIIYAVRTLDDSWRETYEYKSQLASALGIEEDVLEPLVTGRKRRIKVLGTNPPPIE